MTLRVDFPLLTKENWEVFIRLSLFVPSSLFPILTFLHSFFLYYLFVEELFIYYIPSIEILFGFFNLLMVSSIHFEAVSRQQLAACGPSLVVDII